MPAQSANLINIFVNDPGTKDGGLEQIIPPQGESPFAIPGWTGAGGVFDPGTPEFEAGQLHVVLTQTYGAWADFFGADFAWQPGLAQLPIFPRAGKDFNAYYDRKGLKFFFDADKVTGQTIYTCESGDIIAHECGHAVLDAYHPEYWDSLLAETGAFHEAFGDISALLVALDNPRARALMLAENGGDLAKSNSVTRLAEQLARGLFNGGFADAIVSADAMRDLANRFRYRDPDKLPGRAPATRLSSESHNFSRIFSGAFYDVLVGIYEQFREGNTALSSDAALVQARNDAGHLLAQGLMLAPKGDASFKTIAVAMLAASQQNSDGKDFAVLKKVFVARRLLKGWEVLRAIAGEGHTQTSALAPVTSVPLAGRPTWELPTTRIGEDLPSGIRKWIPAAKTEFRLVDEQTRSDQSRVLNYTASRHVEFSGAALGVANGAVVTMTDAVAVRVDRDGKVVSSHYHHADRGQEKRVRDHIAKLVARKRVYAVKEGEAIDLAELIAQRKPYYIAYDERGNKRIRRAFIACGL